MVSRMIITVDNIFEGLINSYLTDFLKFANISLKPFNDSSIKSEVFEFFGTDVEQENWNPTYDNLLYAIRCGQKSVYGKE